MADNSSDFNLQDPSTFAVKQGGLPSNYTYVTKATYTQNGVDLTQFITVRSNSLLSEDQIMNTAEVYLRGGAKYGADEDTEVDIEITGAMRSAALGNI